MTKRPPVNDWKTDYTTAVEYNKLMLESLRAKSDQIRAMKEKLAKVLKITTL